MAHSVKELILYQGVEMKSKGFKEKLKELSTYSEQYETITLFELNTLFGSSLTTAYMFLFSLPLLIFTTQWIALPLTFLILVASIWYFFDEPLWMVDNLKRLSFTSRYLQKCALGLEKITIPAFAFYDQNSGLFQKLNAILLGITAFHVGFIESPNVLWRSVFTLLFISFGATFNAGYICLAGYAFFVLLLI